MVASEREELFKECVETLRPMLWRLTGGFAWDADRDDLLQEIMMRIWLGLPKFEERSKLSTWAYRIGLFTAFNWSRKNRIHSKDEELRESQLPFSSDGDRSTIEMLECIHVALRKLKELDRSILLLALEEVPRSEIAEILGISENAAYVRLHRARRNLSKLLEEEK